MSSGEHIDLTNQEEEDLLKDEGAKDEEFDEEAPLKSASADLPKDSASADPFPDPPVRSETPEETADPKGCDDSSKGEPEKAKRTRVPTVKIKKLPEEDVKGKGVKGRKASRSSSRNKIKAEAGVQGQSRLRDEEESDLPVEDSCTMTQIMGFLQERDQKWNEKLASHFTQVTSAHKEIKETLGSIQTEVVAHSKVSTMLKEKLQGWLPAIDKSVAKLEHSVTEVANTSLTALQTSTFEERMDNLEKNSRYFLVPGNRPASPANRQARPSPDQAEVEDGEVVVIPPQLPQDSSADDLIAGIYSGHETLSAEAASFLKTDVDHVRYLIRDLLPNPPAEGTWQDLERAASNSKRQSEDALRAFKNYRTKTVEGAIRVFETEFRAYRTNAAKGVYKQLIHSCSKRVPLALHQVRKVLGHPKNVFTIDEAFLECKTNSSERSMYPSFAFFGYNYASLREAFDNRSYILKVNSSSHYSSRGSKRSASPRGSQDQRRQRSRSGSEDSQERSSRRPPSAEATAPPTISSSSTAPTAPSIHPSTPSSAPSITPSASSEGFVTTDPPGLFVKHPEMGWVWTPAKKD